MPSTLDLVGQRFGHLVVVELGPARGRTRRWRCRCNCGNEALVDTSNLRSGNSQSCGCLQRTTGQRRIKDLGGRRFGRLVVLNQAPHTPPQRPRWHCRCNCGREVVITGHALQQGGTKSCGCLRQENLDGWGQRLTTHGGHQRAEYRIWQAMKTRCLNPHSPSYRSYGGRGITICPQWREDFAQFYADMGPRPSPQHTIERTDNNRGYEPGNCIWIPANKQARNTRSAYRILQDGRELTLTEACAAAGLRRVLVTQRVQRGWPLIDALYASPGTRRPTPPRPRDSAGRYMRRERGKEQE